MDDAEAKFGSDAPPPPVQVVKVEVGVGKSGAARIHAARHLARLRGLGDPRTIALLVPRHDLGEEQARAFMDLPEARDASLRVAIWRGRAAKNPQRPGELMCIDIETVKAALGAVLDVQATVCKACPYQDQCAFQGQKRIAADMWIGAHELLFSPKPKVFGSLAALIVDESAWRHGLVGIEGQPLLLSLDALRRQDRVPEDRSGLDTDRLFGLRTLAVEAMTALNPGPIPRDAFEAVGLTAAGAREAHALEWRLKIVPDLPGSMTLAERRAALKAAQGNRTVARRARFWKSVEHLLGVGGPIASGWLAVVDEDTDQGPKRNLHLKGRREIGSGWSVPTLVLDALADIELLRPYWPTAVMVSDIAVVSPHQLVV